MMVILLNVSFMVWKSHITISTWDYKALPKVFGGDTVQVHDVKSSKDLKETFDDINTQPNHMHFTEVTMKWDDAPQTLRDISKSFANQNK